MKLMWYALGMAILLISVIPVMACGQATPVSLPDGSPPKTEPVFLPDLVIDSVTYRSVTHHDSWGMPLVNPSGIDLEYTINIRNIGNTPASGLLYVSPGGLVKYAEPAIEHGEVFTAKVLGYRAEDAKTVRFIVNPETKKYKGVIVDDKVDLSDKYTIIRIDESNYENNTYELKF